MRNLFPLNFEESSSPLHLRIDKFYSQIKHLITQQKSKSHSRYLCEKVKNICLHEKKKIETIYPNKNTRHRYFTKYRNAFYAHQLQLHSDLHAIVMEIMKLESTESDARSLHRDQRIDVKANNIALFEMEAFVEACRGSLLQQLESADPYTLAIALMGLTGRRPIEILKTGRFKFINSQQVLFSGQAKTRNAPESRDSYPIPVLADAKIIISALRFVRQKFPVSSWENERVIQFFTGRLIRRMKMLEHCVFPNQHISLNSRALRSLYATSAYHLFSMGTKCSFNAFAARVLGHSHLDKNTANCYTYYGIKPKNDH